MSHQPPALTPAEVQELLALEEPGDQLLAWILRLLAADHPDVVVEDAGGLGPDTALAVVRIDGVSMRITAAPA